MFYAESNRQLHPVAVNVFARNSLLAFLAKHLPRLTCIVSMHKHNLMHLYKKKGRRGDEQAKREREAGKDV